MPTAVENLNVIARISLTTCFVIVWLGGVSADPQAADARIEQRFLTAESAIRLRGVSRLRMALEEGALGNEKLQNLLKQVAALPSSKEYIGPTWFNGLYLRNHAEVERCELGKLILQHLTEFRPKKGIDAMDIALKNGAACIIQELERRGILFEHYLFKYSRNNNLTGLFVLVPWRISTLNVTDTMHRTPIMVAAINNSVDALKFLLYFNPDISTRDLNGKNVEDIVVERGDPSLRQVLTDHLSGKAPSRAVGKPLIYWTQEPRNAK